MKNLDLGAQKKAFQAAYNGNTNPFIEALDQGAKLELDYFGLAPGYTRDTGEIARSLIEVVVDTSFHASGTCEILEEIERRGVILHPFIEARIEPKQVLEDGSNAGGALKFLLDRWPESFGNWEDHFDLHKMASDRDYEKIEIVLKRGLDVDKRDEQGRTPLMYSRHGETIRTLLDAGADIHAADHEEKSPIWHVAKYAIKKMKTGSGKTEIPAEAIHALIEISKNQALTNDKHGALLARQLGRRVTNGLIATGSGTYDQKAFLELIQQINGVLALDRRKKLENAWRGGGRSSKNTVAKPKL